MTDKDMVSIETSRPLEEGAFRVHARVVRPQTGQETPVVPLPETTWRGQDTAISHAEMVQFILTNPEEFGTYQEVLEAATRDYSVKKSTERPQVGEALRGQIAEYIYLDVLPTVPSEQLTPILEKLLQKDTQTFYKYIEQVLLKLVHITELQEAKKKEDMISAIIIFLAIAPQFIPNLPRESMPLFLNKFASKGLNYAQYFKSNLTIHQNYIMAHEKDLVSMSHSVDGEIVPIGFQPYDPKRTFDDLSCVENIAKENLNIQQLTVYKAWYWYIFLTLDAQADNRSVRKIFYTILSKLNPQVIDENLVEDTAKTTQSNPAVSQTAEVAKTKTTIEPKTVALHLSAPDFLVTPTYSAEDVWAIFNKMVEAARDGEITTILKETYGEVPTAPKSKLTAEQTAAITEKISELENSLQSSPDRKLSTSDFHLETEKKQIEQVFAFLWQELSNTKPDTPRFKVILEYLRAQLATFKAEPKTEVAVEAEQKPETVHTVVPSTGDTETQVLPKVVKEEQEPVVTPMRDNETPLSPPPAKSVYQPNDKADTVKITSETIPTAAGD